jgi:mannose-6-phosphate isomerase-like protein (cupin superfamily)
MKPFKKFLIKLQDGRNEPIRDLQGASRIILIDEERAGAEDITFGFSRYEPKTSIHKKHCHTHAEEIMYILAGRGMGGVNDEEYELEKGDTLWVPRGAVHWFYNPYEEPCDFVFIYTRPTLKRAGYEVANPFS